MRSFHKSAGKAKELNENSHLLLNLSSRSYLNRSNMITATKAVIRRKCPERDKHLKHNPNTPDHLIMPVKAKITAHISPVK